MTFAHARPEDDGAWAHARLLIVDDDPSVRKIVRILLEEQFEGPVETAEDGPTAVTAAKKMQPTFVILDYLMPGVDGAMTAKAIREVAPQTRILAFSAVLDFRPVWADAFLPKTEIDRLPNFLRALVKVR